MDWEDRIGRRLKLRDLNILLTVVQRGSMAKAAETLSLALHELVTNSVKYGALTVPDGHIIVTWREELDGEMPRVRLEWHETHTAKNVLPPTRRGFGRDLIERTVPYELRGGSQLTFEANGVHCVIDIPLTPDNVIMGRAGAVG